MSHTRETVGIVVGLLIFAGLLCSYLGYWWSRSYRPGGRAAEQLARLCESLDKAGQWHSTGPVVVRGMLAALVSTNDKIDISVPGTWQGHPTRIALKLDSGLPLTSFWGRMAEGVDGGHYQPPMTLIHMHTQPVPGGLAGLERYDESTVKLNRVFAFLGAVPKLKRLSGDFYGYGDDATIGRLFRPAVRTRASTFPRKLFGLGYGGVVVEGSEIRLRWEGHELDPAVIAAGLELLDAIVNGRD